MTSAFFHGPPGSYKTLSLVERILVPALFQGRPIITNIRGINSLDDIQKLFPTKLIHKDTQLIVIPHDSDGFELIGRFHQWAPPKSLILIDEAQRVFPSSNSKILEQYTYTDKSLTTKYIPKTKDHPLTIPDAFDKHRHHNWDIYLSTTHIDKVHKQVRQVAEWAYRHRDISGLLPWFKHKYRVFRHDSDTTGKSASSIDSITSYSANTQYFKIYQSTATGEAQASALSRSILSEPRLLFFLVLLLTALGYLAYSFINFYSTSTITPQERAKMDYEQAYAALPVDHHISSSVTTNQVSSTSFSHELTNNPYFPARPYLTGSINTNGHINYLIEWIYPDEKNLTTTTDQLTEIGFNVHVYHSCLSKIQFQTQTLYATCKPTDKVIDPVDPQYQQQPQQQVVQNY